MSFDPKRTTAIVLLLFFASGQVYSGASVAEPGSGIPVENSQQTMGILTTQGNNEITVNGTNSISGATILTGTSIETPSDVGAAVRLGSRGSVEIEPNTKLTVEFDQSSVKVVLTEGCINLRTQTGTTGEIITSKASVKTDPARDGKLETCPGGAAQNLPACVGDGLFCHGVAAAVAIIAEGNTAVAVPVAPRGVLY